MAKLDFETTRKIVENAMRANGYKDNLESAWKEQASVDGVEIDSTNNLQNLRDLIAQSIVDALTATEVQGDISTGNDTPKEQQITTNPNVININGDQSSKGVARKDDFVTVSSDTDTDMIEWMENVTTALNNISFAIRSPSVSSTSAVSAETISTPSNIVGKITTSSETVRAGD